MSKAVILCVDDERIILDSLQKEIRQLFKGYVDIEIAESGKEALELLHELNSENIEVPIIISDFIMPNMTGDDFLIKSKNISPNSKRIMLTGQASNEGVGNAMINAGLYRFIEKPWDKNDLELTLAEAFRSFYKEKSIEVNKQKIEQLQNVLEFTIGEKNKNNNKLEDLYNDFYSVFNTIMSYMIAKADKEIYQRVQRINNIGYRICKDEYPELVLKFEFSNLLTHSSIVSIDKYLLNNYLSGRRLDADDSEYIKDKMSFSFYLIENWSFLDDVTDGIKNMFKTFELIDNISKTEQSKTISKILKVTNEYDNLVIRGFEKSTALKKLEAKYIGRDINLIRKIKEIELNIVSESENYEIVKAANLKVGMILYSDILDKSNAVVLRKGEILDHESLLNISKLAKKDRIIEPILVKASE